MSIFRRGTGSLATTVLLIQLAFVAIGAVGPAFCCPPAVGGDAVPDCCKGEGHSCPLKKKAAAAESDGDSLRTCPAANDDQRVVALLFGTNGVLVTLRPLSVPAAVTLVEADVHSAQTVFAVVESPPPRV